MEETLEATADRMLRLVGHGLKPWIVQQLSDIFGDNWTRDAKRIPFPVQNGQALNPDPQVLLSIFDANWERISPGRL
jgi:hypothetical protein